MLKSTNIVIAAFLIIAGFALISMPQTIVSANAQSDRASERACPVPGYTLERGECTAEPTIKFECNPSSVGGVTARLSGSSCSVIGDATQIEDDCREIGAIFAIIPGGSGLAICQFFSMTETPTCPGGVTPTQGGECITKPGRGNDPRT
jgi:hypothetical protein